MTKCGPSAVRYAARALAATFAAACAVTLAGCASYAPPQPWEKGTLAKPEMQLDADPLGARLHDHVYQSKEAAGGGAGVGGGGCGCN